MIIQIVWWLNVLVNGRIGVGRFIYGLTIDNIILRSMSYYVCRILIQTVWWLR